MPKLVNVGTSPAGWPDPTPLAGHAVLSGEAPLTALRPIVDAAPPAGVRQTWTV